MTNAYELKADLEALIAKHTDTLKEIGIDGWLSDGLSELNSSINAMQDSGRDLRAEDAMAFRDSAIRGLRG